MAGLFAAFLGDNPDIQWVLECGHSIVCNEQHRVGQDQYCTKCNNWTTIANWRYHVSE